MRRSLYLSRFGESYIRQKYARRGNVGGTVTKLLIELNKNKLDVDEEEYNSKKFDIKFSEKVGRLSPTQFELRTILQDRFQDESTRGKAIEDAIANVPADSKEYARNILYKLYHKIFVEKLIRYTEIHDMNQDDALEMFVRFNSGGKASKKLRLPCLYLRHTGRAPRRNSARYWWIPTLDLARILSSGPRLCSMEMW